MDKLRIYTENVNTYMDFYDGIDIANYTYSAQRMGDIKISCEFEHSDILDSKWSGREFIIFKNERYYIINKPNCSKTNTEVLYKYSFDAVHEQECLKGIYFMDLATESGTVCEYKYFTNKPSVIYEGTIAEYVARLDINLKTFLSGWSAVLIDGTTSESKLYSITNSFIFDSMRTANETYGTSFYVREKTIYFGDYYNVILNEFEYGKGRGLYTINKTPSSEKPITSITGIGAAENIPYYYPNASEVHGTDWIVPQNRLMPPIYRESYGTQRFYNAIGGQYENQYNANFPNQYILETDIKPTIEKVYFAGQRIDKIVSVVMAVDDNDEVENDTNSSNFGNYKHPNFKINLPPLGFSLFDSLADKDSASIVMKSGRCAGCNFKILYDETKLLSGIVPDTTNTPTQLVVQKDQDTFGTLLPNGSISVNADDIYVFLGINLPNSYIISAENRLKSECLLYMRNNNTAKFTFDCSFDEKYLSVYDIEVALNSKIKIKFNNRVYDNYVDNLSIKYDLTTNIFPVYTVILKEYVKPKASKTLITSANIGNGMTTELFKQNATDRRLRIIPNGSIPISAISQSTRTELDKTRQLAAKSISTDMFNTPNGVPQLDEKNMLPISFVYIDDLISRNDISINQKVFNPELKPIDNEINWTISYKGTNPPIVAMFDARTYQLANQDFEGWRYTHNEVDKEVTISFVYYDTMDANILYAILIG